MDIFATFDERDVVPIGFALFAFVLGVAAGLIIHRTLPAMAATLAAFVGARIAVTKWVRPNLLSPLHQSNAITATSIVGYGSTSGPGAASTLQLAPPNMPNAWIYSTRLIDSTGHGITTAYLQTACPAVVNAGGGPGVPGGLGIGSSAHHTQVPAAAQEALQQCGARVAAVFHEIVTYQPGSRYWDLQWIELGIYLAGAAALAGLCVWWIRRRLA